MLARKRVTGAVATAAISLVLMVGSAAAIPAAQASVAGPARDSAPAAANSMVLARGAGHTPGFRAAMLKDALLKEALSGTRKNAAPRVGAAASTSCSSTIPFSWTPTGTTVTISLFAFWGCNNTTVLTNSQAYVYNGVGGLQGSGNICSGTLPDCSSSSTTIQVPQNSTVWVLFSFTLYNPSIDLDLTETAPLGGCLGNGTHLLTCALMSLQTQV